MSDFRRIYKREVLDTPLYSWAAACRKVLENVRTVWLMPCSLPECLARLSMLLTEAWDRWQLLPDSLIRYQTAAAVAVCLSLAELVFPELVFPERGFPAPALPELFFPALVPSELVFPARV